MPATNVPSPSVSTKVNEARPDGRFGRFACVRIPGAPAAAEGSFGMNRIDIGPFLQRFKRTAAPPITDETRKSISAGA